LGRPCDWDWKSPTPKFPLAFGPRLAQAGAVSVYPTVISPSFTSGAPVCLDQARWFAEQVQPHEAALRNWLRVRFPAISDRDDLVQEAFLRVWQARASITSVKAFLFATTRNLAIDALKRRLPEVDLGECGVSSILDEYSNTAEAVARAQEFQLLNDALQSLPERCRLVFTLRRIHGLSQKEIASRLQISEKTVEAQNSIAMHKCVQFFEELSVAPDRVTRLSPPLVFHAADSVPQHA